MHRIRKAVLVASATALALTAFAAPVAAAGKGTIGIVNGMPGTKVDICVNGKEIRSRVAYGGKTSRVMVSGYKMIKVFKKNPRTCRGTKLAQKMFLLGYGDDFTIVVNKKNPRMVKFDNRNPTFLGSIYPVGVASPHAYVAIRHAADLGKVAMRVSSEYAWSPSAEPPWVEGDEYGWSYFNPPTTTNYTVAAARLGNAGAIAGAIARAGTTYLKPSYRYEFILLGTWAGNAKIIVWRRPVSYIP